MDVTRANFNKELVQSFTNQLERSQFITFDFEFTGLDTSRR